MAENDRPLPTPPRRRFGRQVPGEDEGSEGLTADRLAQAAAEGKLEEVLQHELPEGEHARNLAMMMLGMSGMMPGAAPGMPEMPIGGPRGAAGCVAAALGSEVPAAAPEAIVPPEVLAATMQADVAGLMSLLRAEHERRGGEGPSACAAPAPAPSPVPGPAPALPSAGAPGCAPAGIDKALVDELIRVAADNQVTVDWLLLRAVKLYLEEHRRTGRL